MRRVRFAPLSVEFRILKKVGLNRISSRFKGLNFLELCCYLANVCIFFKKFQDDTYEDSDVYDDDIRVDRFIVGTIRVKMLFLTISKKLYPT